ncbi:MAG: hypothetical protein AAB521_02360 [Patescibacteria group bacterium]
MNKILKDKKILVGIAVVVLAVIIAGGFFVLSANKNNKPASSGIEEEQVLALSPEEIGLSLTLGEDGQRVIMEISKVEDIKSLEYQLSYNSKDDIPRGVIGTVDIKGSSIKKEIVLGTCSDVCHYDEEISNIKIIIKVIKTDGKAYQVEKTLEE